MAFFGGIGKKLGLGSTKDVLGFAANVAATVATRGAVPIQTSPFERSEPQMANMFLPAENNPQFNQRSAISRSNSGSGFFGNLGQSIGNFGRDVGGFVQDISPLTSLFGIGQQPMRSNQGAATTIINQRAEESSSSGELLGANLMGGLGLIQGAGRALRSPVGQGLIGGGLGLAGLALGGGDSGKVRITRRMKADVRRIYMMAGMDPNMTAQILNNLGTYPRMDFDASLVFLILTKRFRNDGAVVTKAAVRKTKTTLRRMKGVVDMYNSVCKPAPRRRTTAAPMKKAIQLIKN